MTTDPRLLLPAADALLRVWCGPVVLDGYDTVARWSNGESSVLVIESPDLEYWVCLDMIGSGRLFLDLSRAECRDRVARALASGDSAFWVYDLGKFGAGWELRSGAGTRWWGRTLPALAGLDPSSDERLPDGSRLVDALALALVAAEVLGGR